MRIVNQLWFVSTHPLKRDDKLRAVLGYLRWLVGIRLLGGEHVYEWVNGSRLLVRQGEAISANVYTGIEEFADMGYLLHVLRKDDLFVDVGANAGAYTVLACAAVGARGHAFEPVPATYQRLLQNLHLNHLEGWVVGHNIGLGSAPGRAAFTTAQGSTNHVLAVGEPSALAIEVGIRNAGLGLVLIFSFFGGLGGMAVVAGVWGFWDIIAGLLLAGWWARKPVAQS